MDTRKARLGALVGIWLLMLLMLSTAADYPISGVPLMVTIAASNMLGAVLMGAAIAVWLGKM